MNRLEEITLSYWEASKAYKSPEVPHMTNSEAFKRLRQLDRCTPDEWKLQSLMHELKFDLVEGNTEWRAQSNEISSASILVMKR